MPPIPSDPASIPTIRNSSAMGRPVRCDARLNSTLTPSRKPQVVSRSAVASGSLTDIGRGYNGRWLLATRSGGETKSCAGSAAVGPAPIVELDDVDQRQCHQSEGREIGVEN